MQCYAETSCRQNASVYRKYRRGASDKRSEGFFFSIGTYGGFFCGSLCTAFRQKQAVDSVYDSCFADCLFQTVSVCPLSNRRAGRHTPWSDCQRCCKCNLPSCRTAYQENNQIIICYMNIKYKKLWNGYA